MKWKYMINLINCTEEVKIMTQEEKQSDNQPLTAQISRLIDLVNYQKGSVVSRTLIDKNAGTVTLFAFDGESTRLFLVLLFFRHVISLLSSYLS